MIVAIGAQNAFVLRQGLRREHILPIVMLCGAADALLITAGIAGLGAILTAQPVAMDIARYGGAAFLAGYAMLAVRRAVRPRAMTAADRAPTTLGAALVTCLGFTFLNPHVYLDTVLLLGSLASQHGDARWLYGAGAVAGSFAWFFALGYGARWLSRFFARPGAWRVLDAVIAGLMLMLAAGLLLT
nr:LysE/ArgO family amino acid transporter [Phytoactinopolyspora alkaliphila]